MIVGLRCYIPNDYVNPYPLVFLFLFMFENEQNHRKS